LGFGRIREKKMTENNFQIDSAAVSDKGLSEKRPQNEDSYLEINERGLFAVADGVGGAQAGDVASQMAMEILAEAFINLRENGDAEEMMKIAIERANEAIYQMSHDLPQLSTMATTIVALHLNGNIATIGNVGDSRIYRLDEKGNLNRETQDHSMVEDEVRAGRMTAHQAATHPNRNVISRALGADSFVEVDMKTIMFEPRTTFLLCSDGITRHIDDVQLRELLQSGDKPADICRRMKEICYERGAEDNLTAVIAKITDVVAGKNNGSRKSVLDFEESTIATARPPQNEARISADKLNEIPTQPLQIPLKEDTSEQNIDLTNEILVPTSVRNSDSAVLQTENIPIADVRKVKIENDLKSYKLEEESGFGKLLSSLLLLLLGGVIGAGAFYLLSQNKSQPEVPQIVEQQTTNSPYSAFEDNRRNVDRNPEQYIFSSNGQAESAEDYYLLGRANLLAGKYPEAKIAFEEAKNRLAQTSEVNSKILANEIAMALAIINNPSAQRAFEKDMSLNKSDSDAQSNTSIGVNANLGSSSPNNTANSSNSNQGLGNN
jgi:protein phosphatase